MPTKSTPSEAPQSPAVLDEGAVFKPFDRAVHVGNSHTHVLRKLLLSWEAKDGAGLPSTAARRSSGNCCRYSVEPPDFVDETAGINESDL